MDLAKELTVKIDRLIVTLDDILDDSKSPGNIKVSLECRYEMKSCDEIVNGLKRDSNYGGLHKSILQHWGSLMSNTVCFVADYCTFDSETYYRCEWEDYVASIPASCFKKKLNDDRPVTCVNDSIQLESSDVFPKDAQQYIDKFYPNLKTHPCYERFKASLYWATRMFECQKDNILNMLEKNLQSYKDRSKLNPMFGLVDEEKIKDMRDDKTNESFVQLFSSFQENCLKFDKIGTWGAVKRPHRDVPRHIVIHSVLLTKNWDDKSTHVGRADGTRILVGSRTVFHEHGGHYLCDCYIDRCRVSPPAIMDESGYKIELSEAEGVFSFDTDLQDDALVGNLYFTTFKNSASPSFSMDKRKRDLNNETKYLVDLTFLHYFFKCYDGSETFWQGLKEYLTLASKLEQKVVTRARGAASPYDGGCGTREEDVGMSDCV